MTRLSIERLLQLMEDTSMTGCEAVDKWKSEYTASVQELQSRAEQYAKDNPTRYGLVRLAMGIMKYGSEFVEALKPQEYVSVTLDDLPRYAKSAGVGLVELTEVLDGKRYEVRGHSKQVYRSWETPPWSS